MKVTTASMYAESKDKIKHLKSGLYITAFEVTGTDSQGKRFSMSFGGTTSGLMHINMINLWEGTRWARLTNGKRVKLNSTYN